MRLRRICIALMLVCIALAGCGLKDDKVIPDTSSDSNQIEDNVSEQDEIDEQSEYDEVYYCDIVNDSVSK